MYHWDNYTKQQQERLRNLQVAREEAWKEEMLVKFEQQDLEHNAAFNDVVDEHSIWFQDAVVKYLDQVAEEYVGRFPDWLYQVFNLGPDRLAYIAVRSAMECIYSSAILRDSDPHSNVWALPLAQTIARDIADKCWDVAAWLKAREAEPFFYRHQSKYFKNWNPKRRRAFTKKVNALPKASQREKDNFGHAMVRLAVEAGLLEAKLVAEKKNSKGGTGKVTKRSYVTLPGDLIQYMMTRIEDYATKLLPNRLPMVCRPVAHTEDETGGMMDWSIRKLRHTTQLKQRPDEDTDNERVVDPSCMSDMTRKAINTLQATEWRVNDRVLQVANDLWRAGRETGTIPPYDQEDLLEMPPFPEDGSKTEQHEWMDEKSRRWGRWAKAEAARLQMQIRMREAYKLKSFVLWHAYFCDFRGRYYSDSYLLHPQGGDLDKALIMAAEPQQVTPEGLYWIKVNLANLMGVDKVSFDDRVKYVDEHMEDWVSVCADPHGTTNIWEDDAPKKNASFQRLAAIFDLIDAIDEGITRVPVQMDGSCNGIQHWAAMTRDETVGPEVNLLPQPKPADVYQLVANGCTDMCSEETSDWRIHFLDHWEGLIPRKVVKRSVMCDPYGITDHSVRQYVLQEKHLDWCTDKGLNLHQAANEMGTLICAAKAKMMEHCNNGKKFVQLLCGWVGGEKDEPMSWYTPAGFLVINKYNPRATKQSRLRVWDKAFILHFAYYTDEYDCDKALTAMPPNFVHSLDAAHMSMVVDRLHDFGITMFSMIHDSFGVMANNVPMMREVTKETFHEIHSVDRLQELQSRAEDLVGAKLPEGHPARNHQQRGTLDIDGVLGAEYLFG
jgi:DNA-directed RNA polymerase